jgi:hypothetical protein
VNECATNNGGCDTLVSCANTPGGSSCGSCPSGYTDTNGDGTVCTDVNECATGNGGCDANAACANNVGGAPTCTCNAGYVGDGQTCTIISDACAPACAAAASCVDDGSGNPVCQCSPGYTGDGVTCTDINECSTNNGGCSPLASCTNTDGGRTCGSCPSGYTGDGITCTDVNECATNNGGCDVLVSCVNTAGGRTCGSCPSGYTDTNGDGTLCQDINECNADNGGCDPLVSCTNTTGGRTCGSCPSGYTDTNGDGTLCADINECTTNNGGCSTLVTCTNIPGSRTCGACPAGYNDTNGDGTVCTDINECLTNNGGCDANATCSNTAGGRTCACDDGYTGDGITCEAAQRICTAVYSLSPTMSIDGTPLGAGDGDFDLPGGTLELRYEAAPSSTSPKSGGAVDIQYLWIRNEFVANTDIGFGSITVDTTVNGYTPRCNGQDVTGWNPPPATCANDGNTTSYASGTYNGSTVTWDACSKPGQWNSEDYDPSDVSTGPGCLNDYHSRGNVDCSASGLISCSSGNLDNGANEQNGVWNMPLGTMNLNSSGMSVSLGNTPIPNDSDGSTSMTFSGTRTSVTCE